MYLSKHAVECLSEFINAKRPFKYRNEFGSYAYIIRASCEHVASFWRHSALVPTTHWRYLRFHDAHVYVKERVFNVDLTLGSETIT